jgi:uridine phosphorylase
MENIGVEPENLDQPVFTAKDMLELRWRLSHHRPAVRPPEAAILCYQPELLRYIRLKYRLQRVRGFFGEIYLFRRGRGRLAIAGNFGVGAPAAVMVLEELAAFGVRQFLSIGLAGGLQSDLQVGAAVVSDSAQRGEGTSAHYLPAGAPAWADPNLTRRVCTALERAKIPFRIGTTWTTDAPYREIRREVAEMQHSGVLAVDMEASALYAAGQTLGAQVGAAFVISDSLVRPQGLAEFSLKVLLRALPRLANAVIDLLAEGEAA